MFFQVRNINIKYTIIKSIFYKYLLSFKTNTNYHICKLSDVIFLSFYIYIIIRNLSYTKKFMYFCSSIE